MPRDNQRQRLYDAEAVLRNRRVSRAATKHLIDTQTVAGWAVTDYDRPSINAETGEQIVFNGEPVYRTKPMKCATIEAVQAYVDAVTQAAWFQARWGQRKITVRPGKGSHGSVGYVTVAQVHRRSEAIILHEIAHGLTGYGCADHGPEFAGILLTLVRYQMGKPHADELRASFKKHRVRYTMNQVPEPKRPVVSQAVRNQQAAAAKRQQQARTKAAQEVVRRRMVGGTARQEAAEVIRANVRAGLFGPAGSKTRTHALATARRLEGK